MSEQFTWVKVLPDGRKFKIVTARLEMVLGARLQKSDEPLPDLPSCGLSKADALQNAKVFDDYIERQNAGKTGQKRGSK